MPSFLNVWFREKEYGKILFSILGVNIFNALVLQQIALPQGLHLTARLTGGYSFESGGIYGIKALSHIYCLDL